GETTFCQLELSQAIHHALASVSTANPATKSHDERPKLGDITYFPDVQENCQQSRKIPKLAVA
ncbi:MAG: hypothetical protein AAF497_22150, partial [Planctomycetota bacterium]